MIVQTNLYETQKREKAVHVECDQPFCHASTARRVIDYPFIFHLQKAASELILGDNTNHVVNNKESVSDLNVEKEQPS